MPLLKCSGSETFTLVIGVGRTLGAMGCFTGLQRSQLLRPPVRTPFRGAVPGPGAAP